MTPKEVSNILRRIAAAIDNSKRPSLDMVQHDLTVVVSKLAQEQQQTGQQQQEGQQQQQQGQQEQQALPKSQSGKGMIEKLIKDLESAHQHGDHDAFKGLLEKLDKAAA